MRITLIIGGIGGGGAERVMTTLAASWVQAGNHVHVICLYDGQNPPFYPQHPAVELEHLGLKFRSISMRESAVNTLRHLVAKRTFCWDSTEPGGCGVNTLRHLVAIRRAVRRSKPSVVVSFMDAVNIMTLLSTAGLRIPVLACEHTYPLGRSIGSLWKYLRLAIYPCAAAVVALTESGLRCFPRRIQSRGAVIPNPVTVPPGYRGCALTKPAGTDKTLIALGRIAPVKGYDLLVSAFASVSQQYSNWSLEIWGDGPNRRDIEALLKTFNIAHRVRLPGVTREPLEKLRAGDLFVLSSRTEGFPMALCEAMACGLPVVSFDCLSGPREIIRDGVDGILVPPGNVDALAAALQRLMGDEALRRKLATRAPEVLDRFSIETVMQEWEALIAKVTQAAGRSRRK
jgi:GalNAc-alpha-(1->4)-GalNAc-alpha-(1->3)-diNAcBac-PP-undecaprenol alpha-1,4-N-acetyl-D-galactosaminyltransferase